MPGTSNHSSGSERKQCIERITALNNKITKARELLLNDDIEPTDFRAVKMEAEREITVLESKISDLQVNKMTLAEVDKTIDSALINLTNLKNIYCDSDNYARRNLIGSIFPEKFTIEDLQVRTAKPSEVFQFIYLINSKLSGNKKGTNDNFYRLSQGVIPLGFEPRTPTLKVLCSTS
jgi:site-specific DNA recombinase